MALHAYSWDGPHPWSYQGVNPFLRGQLTPEEAERRQRLFFDLVAALDSGLEKLPRYEGTTYRGMNLPVPLIEQWIADGQITDPAYVSSSKDNEISFGERFSGNVQMIIESKSGRDIEPIARKTNEREVLFARGTEFDILNVKENEGVFTIKVEER